MEVKFFTNVIAMVALTVTFSSCEKEDSENINYGGLKNICKGGVVYSSIEYSKNDICYENDGSKSTLYYGTDINNLDNEFVKETLTANTKYYFQVKGYNIDNKTGKKTTYSSEIGFVYCVEPLQINGIEYGEADVSALIKWKPNKSFDNVKVTIRPKMECGFVGCTFVVSNGQDSLSISCTNNKEIPYMLNDFDDAHGVNYQPIIYDFIVSADIAFDDATVQIKDSLSDIFLNGSCYMRDHEYNVYRIAELGNQIWMADDLRCITDIYGSSIDYVISELSSGAKGVLYNLEEIMLFDVAPEGYHYATIYDWVTLLNFYGVPVTVDDLTSDQLVYSPATTLLDDYPDLYTKLDSIADVYNLQSAKTHLWKEVFASASDWVDNMGNNVFPATSILNIKPFGYAYNGEFKGQGVSALYYSYEYSKLFSFYYRKDGVGCYPSKQLYNFWNEHYYMPVRLVKDK